jgi:uncharacterized membrane protein YphA (DoxX/SURF4 family)
MKAVFLLGRVILGGFFLYNGINHFKQREGMVGYASSKNVPNPELAVIASAVLLTAGGASLMLGVKPKFGLLPLLGFLAVVSPTMHDFWNETDPQSQQQQMIHFSKNMALLGAILALMGVEEWPASLAAS